MVGLPVMKDKELRNKSISNVVSIKYFKGGFAKKACPTFL